MPVGIDDHTRDRTLGTIRSTPFSWLKQGTFSNVEYGDRRAWRLFKQAQVDVIIAKTDHIPATSRSG
jgi:hypothetical protein